MIELRGRKVWGSGSSGYGDQNWKEKMKSLISNQDYVIVEGRYEGGKYHYFMDCHPFSLLNKEEFLQKLDKMNLGYGDNVYLYDIFENEKIIWVKKTDITERNRYIFVSHTATECQML